MLISNVLIVYVFMTLTFLNQYPHITRNLEIRGRQKNSHDPSFGCISSTLQRHILYDSYQVKHIKLSLFILSLPLTLSLGGRYQYNQSLQMSNVSLSKWTLIGQIHYNSFSHFPIVEQRFPCNILLLLIIYEDTFICKGFPLFGTLYLK